MDAETRQRLRETVSRARVAAFDWAAEPRCSGCNVELRDPWSEAPRFVDGCASCWQRHRSQERREAEAVAAVEGTPQLALAV